MKNKKYNSGKMRPEPFHMCPDDGYVCFRDSEHISGVLDKSILGGGSKSSLFAALLRDHSAEASALAMGRLAKLTARFLVRRALGIDPRSCHDVLADELDVRDGLRIVGIMVDMEKFYDNIDVNKLCYLGMDHDYPIVIMRIQLGTLTV